MKKTMLILAAICMTMAANAKILRVSNVSGSSAPYTTFDAAQDAAEDGDTIMFDASDKDYGAIMMSANKRLVLKGPGYWLTNNNIVNDGAGEAKTGTITVNKEGTVIEGLVVKHIDITVPHVVVKRCQTGNIVFSDGADNCIIHQNFLNGIIYSGGKGNTSYHQITNNIFNKNGSWTYFEIKHINDSRIAYNTSLKKLNFISVNNSTMEYNIAPKYGIGSSENYVFQNNYETDVYGSSKVSIDSDYFNVEIADEIRQTYGAFAGDSPYVISGVPSGPIITDVNMASSVEQGSAPTVTIKVSISK